MIRAYHPRLSRHLNVFLIYSSRFFFAAAAALLLLSARNMIQKKPIRFATSTLNIGGTKLKLMKTGSDKNFQLVSKTLMYKFFKFPNACSGVLPSKIDRK